MCARDQADHTASIRKHELLLIVSHVLSGCDEKNEKASAASTSVYGGSPSAVRVVACCDRRVVRTIPCRAAPVLLLLCRCGNRLTQHQQRRVATAAAVRVVGYSLLVHVADAPLIGNRHFRPQFGHFFAFVCKKFHAKNETGARNVAADKLSAWAYTRVVYRSVQCNSGTTRTAHDVTPTRAAPGCYRCCVRWMRLVSYMWRMLS